MCFLMSLLWLLFQTLGYAPDFIQAVMKPLIKPIKEKGKSHGTPVIFLECEQCLIFIEKIIEVLYASKMQELNASAQRKK